MLVLTRKVDEKIRIGNDITVTVVQLNRNAAKLGIEAPDDVIIKREIKSGIRKGNDYQRQQEN